MEILIFAGMNQNKRSWAVKILYQIWYCKILYQIWYCKILKFYNLSGTYPWKLCLIKRKMSWNLIRFWVQGFRFLKEGHYKLRLETFTFILQKWQNVLFSWSYRPLLFPYLPNTSKFCLSNIITIIPIFWLH